MNYERENRARTLSELYIDAVSSKPSYMIIHMLWLVGALIVLFGAFSEIQNAVPLDFARPNALKNSFIPLYTHDGAERTIFRIQGLMIQFCVVLILVLKAHFILSRTSTSLVANYLLSAVLSPLLIYYVMWSDSLIGCKDCSSDATPFFPSTYWSGVFFLVYSVFMLVADALCLLVLLFERWRRSMRWKPSV